MNDQRFVMLMNESSIVSHGIVNVGVVPILDIVLLFAAVFDLLVISFRICTIKPK